jgi:hypothetical protein
MATRFRPTRRRAKPAKFNLALAISSDIMGGLKQKRERKV